MARHLIGRNAMDLPPETDEYIRESIENSLGLLVSDKTLHLKLLVSEDERRRLQDKIFSLQDHLAEADRRLERHRVRSLTPGSFVRYLWLSASRVLRSIQFSRSYV